MKRSVRFPFIDEGKALFFIPLFFRNHTAFLQFERLEIPGRRRGVLLKIEPLKVLDLMV